MLDGFESNATPLDGPRPQLDVGRLRIAAIIAPALFISLLLVLAVVLVDRVPLMLLVSAGVLAAAAAAAIFSAVIFAVVERGEAHIVESNERLSALRLAAMSIAGEYELSPLLQRFVDVSRQLANARYGALSVINADGGIMEFITSGMSDEERARIGHLPVGRGLLGVILQEGGLRLDDMSQDPRSAGFPPNHPPMRSLLGVPVKSRGATLGNLYLTDKLDAPVFSDADEQLVRTFAAHAALAIETSRLQNEARDIAVLRERERIGMDLHDGIIQSIYAVELGLEGMEEDVEANPPAARTALADAIDKLNGVIRDVRSYIFELRPAKLSYDLSEDIMRIVEEFRAGSAARIDADIAPALPPLGEERQLALCHIARDALANANRHAKASRIQLSLHADVNNVRLSVSDDGRGFEAGVDLPDTHRGLRNMAERARLAGGTLTVESAPGAGTAVFAEVPIRLQEAVSA